MATASTKTAGEVYQELVTLRNSAGESLYLRIGLAQRLLSDREWVRLPEGGGGDESRAIDRLEDTAFGDVCGAISLPDMLELLRRVPEKSAWKANRFNLRKMVGEMKARDEARRPPRKPAPPLPPNSNTGTLEPQQVVRRLQEELREAKEHAKSDMQLLKEENRELKAENGRLRAAVRSLQAAINALQPA